MEDSGLQIIRLWGPTIGNFKNTNFEILDLLSQMAAKPGPCGGRAYVCMHIYIYIHFGGTQTGGLIFWSSLLLFDAG